MNVSSWIERHADFAPDKIAIDFEGQKISYADLEQRIQRVAAALSNELAVARGDRVGFLGYNSPDMLILVFACARIGAILVPLNWRLAAPEHNFILQDAGIKLLIVEPSFKEGIDKIRAEHPHCCFVLQDKACEGWLSYQDVLAASDIGLADNVDIDYQQPLLIVYTSGTTGRPKGAVLRQQAILYNALNSLHMHDMNSSDHVLTVLPLFHVGGLNIQTLPALYAGASVTLHARFDPTAFLNALASAKPTLTVLVPATLRALIQHPDWLCTDLSCLRCVTTGSSIVPINLIEPFHEKSIPVMQVYGLTETAPIAIYQRREDAERTLGSTGKPALHCQIRVVDNDGLDVATGQSGEILIRGNNVLSEYWNNPEATQDALRDSWFYSGDIGHQDQQGNFFIDDRKKDVVVSGGENIYPAELEMIIHELQGVNDAVVVARADEQWGEVPVAVIERKADSGLTEHDIYAAFEGKLARYKRPREVLFVEQLPRNAMGKVLKYEVRDWVNTKSPD